MQGRSFLRTLYFFKPALLVIWVSWICSDRLLGQSINQQTHVKHLHLFLNHTYVSQLRLLKGGNRKKEEINKKKVWSRECYIHSSYEQWVWNENSHKSNNINGIGYNIKDTLISLLKTLLYNLCYVFSWMFCNFFFPGMTIIKPIAFLSFSPYFVSLLFWYFLMYVFIFMDIKIDDDWRWYHTAYLATI